MNKLRVVSRSKLDGSYKTEMKFYDQKTKIEKGWFHCDELQVIVNHKNARLEAQRYATSLWDKAKELNLQDVEIDATYYEFYSQTEYEGEIIERRGDFNLNKTVWQNGKWT